MEWTLDFHRGPPVAAVPPIAAATADHHLVACGVHAVAPDGD